MTQKEILKQRIKYLRKNATEAERKLWYFLRARRFNRFKFRRQHLVENYIVDFICEWKKIIIELDGGQHSLNVKYDSNRTRLLEKKGYKVLRFWNLQISREIEEVLQQIYI